MTSLEQHRAGDVYALVQHELFPTFAAFEAHRLLGVPAQESVVAATHAALRRFGLSRAIGAQPGAPADAWSTAYGCQIMVRAGHAVPPAWAAYLHNLRTGPAYAMAMGQPPEMWATSFSILGLRAAHETIPASDDLLAWVAASQCACGGFSWSPAWTPTDLADVRATSFILQALRAAGLLGRLDEFVDVDRLEKWLQNCQSTGGAFVLNRVLRDAGCLWACGEAVTALELLGERPRDQKALIGFVDERRCADGGLSRGDAFPPRSDIWSTWHGVRIDTILKAGLAPAELVMPFLHSCVSSAGGYGYAPATRAGDAFATSAAILADGAADVEACAAFLREDCAMPGGGVAYMPGRGAETRTTQWATEACALAGAPIDPVLTARWLYRSQEPGAGWGAWEGRASTAMATCAALETAARVTPKVVDEIDATSAVAFISAKLAMALDGGADLVETAYTIRAARILALDVPGELLDRLRTGLRGSGFCGRRRGIAGDLASTYQILLAVQALDDAAAAIQAAATEAAALRDPDGHARWSAFSSLPAGPLADALAHQLDLAAAHGAPLLQLTL
jgi:prenyltransferase beta subunit